MIYTAVQTRGQPQSPAFAQRGISGLTSAKMSDVPVSGQRRAYQLAYDGYRANIDVFLAATATGTKLRTNIIGAPIGEDYIPSIPLRTPKVMFTSPRATKDAAYKAQLSAKLAKYNFQEHKFGKGGSNFSIDHPTLKIIESVLPTIAPSTCNASELYATVEGASASTILYRIIDLFLRVNTYPYSKTLDGMIAHDDEGIRNMEILLRAETIGKDSGEARKKRRELSVVTEDIPMADAEDLNREDELTHRSLLYTEVLAAKPSPMPSSVNFGLPTGVPNLPGIVFPYFRGMLSPDTSFIRATCSRFFFRNFAKDTSNNARDGFKAFRQQINTFANTPEGLIVSHILKGIELALDCQAQLYVMIDEEYRGFVLLGGLYTVFAHGEWVFPLGAEELRAELDLITTHRSSLYKIALLLQDSDALDGESLAECSIDDIDTPLKLCKTLAKLEIDEDEGVDEDLVTAMKGLSFASRYKGIGPDTLRWLLQALGPDFAVPFPDDLPVYVPLQDWASLGRKEFQALLAFGPRAPSFRSSNGIEYSIPRPTESDPLSDNGPTQEKKMSIIVVGAKPPLQALRDWDMMVAKRSIRFDPAERAKGSRCYTYSKANRDKIWEGLRITSERWANGEDDKGKGKAKVVPAKRQYDETVDLDAFDFE